MRPAGWFCRRLSRLIPRARSVRILLAFAVLPTMTFLVPSRALRAQQSVVRLAIFPTGDVGDSGVASAPSTGWTDNRCGSCHRIDPLFSHPVGVAPTMAVPENLPLQQGQITCVTCHDDRAVAHAAARATHSPLLRETTSNRKGFCAQCHDLSEHSRKGQHGTALGKAHLAWAKKGNSLRASPGGFDEETQTCLSCHDGLVSSDVAMTQAAAGRVDLIPDHPIGASMSLGNLNDFHLRAPENLDARIRLFDGRVGCNSCHSPYSSHPKLLVMSNHKSQLCLSCHQQ
jgi:predicted CXXCH cytochrome family protein